LLAAVLFAFTPAAYSPDQRTDLTWFEVDVNGNAINPLTGGIRSALVPGSFECEGEHEIFCAFGYEPGDVISNGDGTYRLKDASMTFDPLEDYEAIAEKEE
jgi:hypothetical protein